MKYEINGASVSFEDRMILDHIHMEICDGQKIAVTGVNGAGKTTLLRLLAGEITPDRDDKQKGPGLLLSRSMTILSLSQIISAKEQDRRVKDLFLERFRGDEKYSRERFSFETECDRMLTGLGFSVEDKKRPLREFSGGQQTKLRLIRILLEKPDLLLLDEPTNHLDLSSVEWLEAYMKHYQGAVVYVSHDRYFLDEVAEICYDLEEETLTRYIGNYTESRRQKEKNYFLALKAYEKQQEEIKNLEDLIRAFKNKPKKASFARSRKTILDRMVRLQPPRGLKAHLFTGPIQPAHPGSKWVIDADHLQVGYGKKALLELTFRVKRGQKIAVIGENGAGKTTLLRTLAGFLEPVKGSFTLGPHTRLGFFDQKSAEITSELNVLEHFHRLYPGYDEKEARKVLADYLFGGAKAQTKISDLSGGERSRLVLCELMTAAPNLLLLDEPTNHMDIPAKETLESAFRQYTGTILFVSHDRYFIREICDAVLVLEGGSVTYYPFGYENYRKKSAQKDLLPSAIISAENSALMEHFKTAARPERHETRPLTSDEAYVDWKLRLAGEELDAAREKLEEFLTIWDEDYALWQDQIQSLKNASEQAGPDPDDLPFPSFEEKEAAFAEFDLACRKWFDVLLSLE